MKIILASSSPHRRALLERLRLEFEVVAPEIDERAQPEEAPGELVSRLAEAKARAVAHISGADLIIASDQTASIDGGFLGKPGTLELARAQLQSQRGRTVSFLTGLCLLNARTGRSQSAVETAVVRLRNLSDTQIRAYVGAEEPVDMAGGFKSEGLGIALFETIESNDPTILIGLPLIRLVEFLANEGVDVLS